MDSIDLKLLDLLAANARASWAELAGELGLSAPAVAERARKLGERGVLRGYAALVEPEAVGLGLLAFVAVTLNRPEHRAAFTDAVRAHPAVQECHHLAGDDDYLLKVRCASTRALERLVSDDLKGLPGVARTRTMIALSTLKETPRLPLPLPAPDDVSGGEGD